MGRITLTFDNGPHLEGTPEILDFLRQRGIQATFFLVGERLLDPTLQPLAARIRAEGHRIGNHTLTHSTALGRTMGREKARVEIGGAQELVSAYGAAKLFRPNGEKGRLGPHMLSEDAVEFLESNEFTAVSWNCVPCDWIGPVGAWVDRARQAIREHDWPVLVLHDHCQAGAISCLASFLDELIEQNWKFTFDYPADVVLLDKGKRTAALVGNYTPRGEFTDQPVGT